MLQKQTFSKIVTHNPSGEYGHQHHKMTSSIVTNIAKELNKTNCLYYFGKYYKKTSPMLSMKPTFNEELLKQKINYSQYIRRKIKFVSIYNI
ncbi:hypothetical protein SD457_24670 [Coprobacillaceae bacterium CR2/5/TPMF4]|nr:hypothetical protein SD457_24670 [Coprobacillaceae bacterium CR2/5/TPMF4]